MTPALARELRRVLPASVRRAAKLRLGVGAALPQAGPDYGRYRLDPVGYARDVLGVEWWAKQREIAEALIRPPYRVLVKASHSVGKSHLAGGLVNWWYDTRNPGVCLTTAPTYRQVKDVLWKEVRRQRGGRPGFPGPKLPRLEDSPTHFATGLTSTNATAFQGQHERAVLIVLDEAVGIDREIWEAADSMTMGVEYGIVAFCNPTDSGSEFYQREQAGGWTVVHIPVLEHPNIAAELAGRPAPYPAAARLEWLTARLDEWATPVGAGDHLPTDVEWPPGTGRYLRPGPLAEARLLGKWPSAASGVWSDVLWDVAEQSGAGWQASDELPEIGCDVARFGDDNTEIHVRWGRCSVHHEWHNGWDTAQTAGRLKQLCREWADEATRQRPAGLSPVDPKQIAVKVDTDGIGGGVFDNADCYRFVPVRASGTSTRPDDFPNVRSELWFATAERAKAGLVDVSRLDQRTRSELKRQAVAPHYVLDSAGRRVVERKDVTKEKIGRSPDGMDALNLAYYEASAGEAATWLGTKAQEPDRRGDRRPGATDARPGWLRQRG